MAVESEETLNVEDLLQEAEHFVKDKFKDHDPSHDRHHGMLLLMSNDEREEKTEMYCIFYSTKSQIDGPQSIKMSFSW